ncbi:putative methylesterase 11, chloroplastic [Cryptomeria japonica]|uniref:putative methylesterase 11, chloroplastic n=1 Tax=Cryptomeria japonica TaxID=3369 RepID=UPI0025ACDA9C|nr:putative methylesterase 11, chloroplastic [Cryptomeria japonica]XP_057817498.1 putative methylesterase 11, chloroplastic [Cryptomeria japonica]XP_057817499.1 putative methylesterase 11, chloroplastic [Cryptomeria japonica]XP_057817500.1 putative methylesterase 11, chloroplastic [Cryptomeria japonica]XP_057817501.1 putative methylesterase 11, chloroplastic [Cryptomeria japonica]XP_057817502.1 putative methylesterase 11, chloroplastic [Cryptomeria japonica]
MGNQLICMPSKHGKQIKSGSKVRTKSKRKMGLEEELLHQQALAMALHQQQMAQIRSISQRYQAPNSKQGLPRSSSARPRNQSDLIVPAHQLLNEDAKALDNLETKHFVLIHGGGFGAWCWYKSIALLEEAGFTATALDLTGSGIDQTQTNSITTLAQYAKPLLDYLGNLPEGNKVILVAHSFGGACISYAMECFPIKIAKAVFVTATMVKDGQRAFDAFAQELSTPNDLIQDARIFIYGNGNENPPTGLEFDRNQLKELFFNQSPTKDIALATVSMRAIPFAPVMERISLTEENYGSVRRFFIQTPEDQALTPAAQQRLIDANPPERVFKVKGSDHCPFFAKPQSLHKVFLEIARLEKF